jgi:hypothetical protein
MRTLLLAGLLVECGLTACTTDRDTAGPVARFQNGVGGYLGAADASISSRDLDATQGAGVTIRAEKLPCSVDPGTGESRVLLKFGDLSLPPNAAVRSATLRLTVEAATGLNLKGAYLLAKWDPEAGPLGWLFRDGENRWSAPGASGEGSDWIAGKVFAAGGFTGAGDHALSIALDTEIVRRWVREPDSNHGVLLSNAVAEEPLFIHSSRSADEANRPALEIEWETPPAVSVLQPAQGAVVSGTIAVEAAAAAGAAASGIQFLLDQEPFGEEIAEAPFRTALDTTRLKNGNHTIAARLRDAAGNTIDSAPAVFTASNPVSGPSYFAAPQSNGEIRVRLTPAESQAAAPQRLVTFGVPFPRGSLKVRDLNTLRVLRAGREVPAYVDMLTPWRHVSNSALDGGFVRVARVQVSLALTAAEEITVEWGRQPRTSAIEKPRNPREGWRTAASGTFVAADGVSEPDVLATLPASWLAQAGLRPMPMLPFDPAVAEARMDPQQSLNAAGGGGRMHQEAAKNFFYTIINEDDPRVTAANRCPYKSDFEPWLYDRPAAMYNLYLQSGFLKPLREAVRHSEFYAKQLYPPGTTPREAVGLFRLKTPNPASWAAVENFLIYSSNENLAYAYWLTGDDSYREPIRWVAQAFLTHEKDVRWSPSVNNWTERNAGMALNAMTIAYEVFGDEVYKSQMLKILAGLRWHQEGAGGALPENRVPGGLYHYGNQHDPEEARAGELVASPWMSALIANAAARSFGVTEDPGTAEFLRQLGWFLAASSKLDREHGYSAAPGALRYSDYLTFFDGKSHTRSGGTGVEHALNVASAAAWSYYFSRYLGVDGGQFKTLASELLATQVAGVRTWTRPAGPQGGAPAYRVAPWRKYAWQYGPSPSVFWILQ